MFDMKLASDIKHRYTHLSNYIFRKAIVSQGRPRYLAPRPCIMVTSLGIGNASLNKIQAATVIIIIRRRTFKTTTTTRIRIRIRMRLNRETRLIFQCKIIILECCSTFIYPIPPRIWMHSSATNHAASWEYNEQFLCYALSNNFGSKNGLDHI